LDEFILISAYVNVFMHFHGIAHYYSDMSIDSCSGSIYPLPKIEALNSHSLDIVIIEQWTTISSVEQTQEWVFGRIERLPALLLQYLSSSS
jgi:hypothetical protein